MDHSNRKVTHCISKAVSPNKPSHPLVAPCQVFDLSDKKMNTYAIPEQPLLGTEDGQDMLLDAGPSPEFTGGTGTYRIFCEKNELEERQMRKLWWEEMNVRGEKHQEIKQMRTSIELALFLLFIGTLLTRLTWKRTKLSCKKQPPSV